VGGERSERGERQRRAAAALREIAEAIAALLADEQPPRPLAESLAAWRVAFSSGDDAEGALALRGRLAEVENERDALRARNAELLEQVLALTQRLQAARRAEVALRVEAGKAAAPPVGESLPEQQAIDAELARVRREAEERTRAARSALEALFPAREPAPAAATPRRQRARKPHAAAAKPRKASKRSNSAPRSKRGSTRGKRR
jgi:hypothetical protein